ncbi:MAG: hypothetical protein B7X82_15530 [Hydrogenophilales bacterium 17-64-65]|nr:MAG: hypothetical protein B7X82_15530 [Hydrogenophilales bacterium 17-64-65]
MTASLSATFAMKPDLRVGPSRPASSMFQHSRISPAALVGVAFAHAALLGLLLLAPDTTEPITPPRPLMVSLIEPEVEEPQPQPKRQPKLQPPKPVVKPLPPPPILEGTVRLNILVNPDGSVAQLEVAKSSGYPRLDRSAIETVQSSWKFEPARQGGMPVAAWVIVPIQFTLRS